MGSETVARFSGGLANAAAAMLQTIPASRADASGSTTRQVDARVPVRNPAVKGPLAPGGEWLIEKAGRSAASIAITRVPRSDDVTYEIVNFMDGARSIGEIRDAVSAEFEPVALAAVSEYIELLAKAGAVTFKP